MAFLFGWAEVTTLFFGLMALPGSRIYWRNWTLSRPPDISKCNGTLATSSFSWILLSLALLTFIVYRNPMHSRIHSHQSTSSEVLPLFGNPQYLDVLDVALSSARRTFNHDSPSKRDSSHACSQSPPQLGPHQPSFYRECGAPVLFPCAFCDAQYFDETGASPIRCLSQHTYVVY